MIYNNVFLFIIILPNLVFDITTPVPVFSALQTISESSNDSVLLSFSSFPRMRIFHCITFILFTYFSQSSVYICRLFANVLRIIRWEMFADR